MWRKAAQIPLSDKSEPDLCICDLQNRCLLFKWFDFLNFECIWISSIYSPQTNWDKFLCIICIRVIFSSLGKNLPSRKPSNLSFILIMVSIQLRPQDAGLQIHVIQGLLPIQSSLPLSVFDDPFLAALHGVNHERDVKNSTKPKTRPPPPPKQMRKINANWQVCSPSKRDLRATFDCIWQSNSR